MKKKSQTKLVTTTRKTSPQGRTIIKEQGGELLKSSRIPLIQRREQLIVNVRAALDKLENSGSAAIALCMMNADTIQEYVKAHAEQERFDVPGFCEGVFLIARDVAQQFEKALQLYREGVAQLIDSGTNGLGLVEMEHAIGALHHLLNVEVGVISTPGNSEVVGCNFSAMARLKEAWLIAHCACGELHKFQHPLEAAA